MDMGNKLKGKDAYIIEKAINEGWLKVFVFVCWAVTWSETFEHLYALYLKFSVCKPECLFRGDMWGSCNERCAECSRRER